MEGTPLDQVVRSIDRLVGLLAPADRLGVVAFADAASSVAPLAPVTEASNRLVSARIRRIVAEGGTNVEAGLRRAAEMMPPRGEHERQVILLLSDGAANRGMTGEHDLAELAHARRRDIGVSTLGYGKDHNQDMLAAISAAGAGRYHFIPDPSVCELELAEALGAQGDVVAEANELALHLGPGVDVVRVLGRYAMRRSAQGIVVELPDLLEGSRHAVVVELAIRTPSEPGPFPLARAEVSYRVAGDRAPRRFEASLQVDVGHGGARGSPGTRAEVRLALADEARRAARALADEGRYDAAAELLRGEIEAIQAELCLGGDDGSRLADAVEQLLDEADIFARKPSREAYLSLRKTQLAVSLADDSSDPRAAPMSSQVLGIVGGTLPRAEVVILAGSEAGKRHTLGQGKAVIGRTSSADIYLHDRNVSRRHAMIVAQGGRFLVMDLGGADGTRLNGERLDRPRVLEAGDVIRVGEVELRYEELPR
jgi:Ca-activated chloride channel family protein